MKSISDKLETNTSTFTGKISTLQQNFDKLSVSIDTEKIEILNSLSKEDLIEIKRLSAKTPTYDQSIKANETKIGELIDSSNFSE